MNELGVFMDQTRNWCRGEIIDLDSYNFDILQKVANPTYETWKDCAGTFRNDSWVPAYVQNPTFPIISCEVPSGNVGNIHSCTATLEGNQSATCGGCMDSTSLSNLITTSTDLTSQLSNRYSPLCTFI